MAATLALAGLLLARAPAEPATGDVNTRVQAVFDQAGIPAVTRARWVERHTSQHARCTVGWALGEAERAPLLLDTLLVDRTTALLDAMDPGMLEPLATRASASAPPVVHERARDFVADVAVALGQRRASSGCAPRRMTHRLGRFTLGVWLLQRGRADVGAVQRETSDPQLSALRADLAHVLAQQADIDHRAFAPTGHVRAMLERVVALQPDAAKTQAVRAMLQALPGPPRRADGALQAVLLRLPDQAMSLDGSYSRPSDLPDRTPPSWSAHARVRNPARELLAMGLGAVPALVARLDDPTVTRARRSGRLEFVSVGETSRMILGRIAGTPMPTPESARAWWQARCARDGFAAALQRHHDAPAHERAAATRALFVAALLPGPLHAGLAAWLREPPAVKPGG
ncbi:MAG: hypothetical protein K1X88_25780 [Nannocystaceae bacterium]|nr:hypothetical protein [Nannocystaceae bacterium]